VRAASLPALKARSLRSTALATIVERGGAPAGFALWRQALKKNGQGCYDVRSREIKNQFPSDCNSRARLFIRCYRANHGTELFISVELPGKGATHQVTAQP
jgi:hypothetical protein